MSLQNATDVKSHDIAQTELHTKSVFSKYDALHKMKMKIKRRLISLLRVSQFVIALANFAK